MDADQRILPFLTWENIESIRIFPPFLPTKYTEQYLREREYELKERKIDTVSALK